MKSPGLGFLPPEFGSRLPPRSHSRRQGGFFATDCVSAYLWCTFRVFLPICHFLSQPKLVASELHNGANRSP